MDIPALAIGAAATGALTGVGPCAAPRFIAVVSLAGHATLHTRCFRFALFALGLGAGYITIGCTASLLTHIAVVSAYTYGALAAVFAMFGLRVLLTRSTHSCATDVDEPVSIGRCIVVGASFALVASPCCTPVIAALAGITAPLNDSASTAIVVGSFAIGHMLPLGIGGIGLRSILDRLTPLTLDNAASAISGGLMLGLAGYYGLLA